MKLFKQFVFTFNFLLWNSLVNGLKCQIGKRISQGGTILSDALTIGRCTSFENVCIRYEIRGTVNREEGELHEWLDSICNSCIFEKMFGDREL